MGARIAPPFMEATDASRLVCVVVVSYQEYSLTHLPGAPSLSSPSSPQVLHTTGAQSDGLTATHGLFTGGEAAHVLRMTYARVAVAVSPVLK